MSLRLYAVGLPVLLKTSVKFLDNFVEKKVYLSLIPSTYVKSKVLGFFF